jgi:hypothetical protein
MENGVCGVWENGVRFILERENGVRFNLEKGVKKVL